MKIIASLLPVWLTLVSLATAADGLPPAEQRRLESGVTNYFAGKTALALNYFSTLAAAGGEARVAAVDKYFAEKKLPPLATLLAEARLKAIHDGSEVKLPRPRAKQILLELPLLVANYDNEANYVRQHPLVNQPVPEALSVIEYERQLAIVQGLTNALTEAGQVLTALGGLVKYVSSAERTRLPPKLAAMVHRDYRSEAESLQDLQRTLAAIDAAMRVRRLKRAIVALGGQGSRAERLLAAQTWQEDGFVLDAFFKRFNKGLTISHPEGLAELADPRLRDRVHADVERARGLAGELTDKANELYLALYWWMRGRYGEGSDVFGLAKRENSVDNKNAARDLYTPDEPPKPTDPAKLTDPDLSVPHYARRHFYWWAWENRQLASGVLGTRGLMESNVHAVQRQMVWVNGIPHVSH